MEKTNKTEEECKCDCKRIGIPDFRMEKCGCKCHKVSESMEHETQDGFCCACEYDIAVIKDEYSFSRSQFKEEVVKKVEELKNHADWTAKSADDTLNVKLSAIYNGAISEVLSIIQGLK